MLNIEQKSVVSEVIDRQHRFKKLELKAEEFQNLIDSLVSILPSHYISPDSLVDTLKRLGKPAAAEKLRNKLPKVAKLRSGDIGEILASDYIQEYSPFDVPIRKLWWRDHQNMSMRGDDVIGILINPETQTLHFLKVEAKSSRSLSRDILNRARTELDSTEGLPSPHALSFVADRLREMGNQDLANRIEEAQYKKGIRNNQVEHFLFTFTQSNPSSLQKESFDEYKGSIKQLSVGLKVHDHSSLIASTYQGVSDALDD